MCDHVHVINEKGVKHAYNTKNIENFFK